MERDRFAASTNHSSPHLTVILFDLIYGTILGIQIFTPAFVLAGERVVAVL